MFNSSIEFTNVVSGMPLSETFLLSLVDYDNQVMNLVNTSQIKITSAIDGAKLNGIDTSGLTAGQAEFSNLQFVYRPGETNVEFLASCDLINDDKVSYLNLSASSAIDVSFRYCQPGGIEVDNER